MRKEKLIGKFKDIDIYPVTTQSLSAGRSNLEVLEGIIAGGAKIVQLREKELNKAEFYELALAFRRRTAAAEMLLIINDHVDIALAVKADGVHLGQQDLPLAAAREIAPDLLIGRSTHNLDQALQAQNEGADYVNIGPIFPTGTKPEHKHFLGPQAIGEIGPHLQIPFTIMGGINLNNIDRVVEAGARHIAVVTAITKAPDIAQATKELRQRILRGG